MAQQIVNIGAAANDNTGDSIRVGGGKINDNFTELYGLQLDNRVIVKQASDFGTIDSTKQYFIDGVVDMSSTKIVVPSGGIHINGYGLDTSKLISTDNSFVLFTDSSDSGNVLINNCTIEISGSSSSVFALTSNTGFEAAEFNIVNFDNCTSLGYLDGFRQGLETGTGRFGGTPSLEFRGTWLGGYRVVTSIARMLRNKTHSLFRCAVGQTFGSRFGGNPNIDLPSNVTFLEATSSNFPNDNTVQLQDALFIGDGTVLNGLTESDTAVRVSNTSGIQNTYVGGFWSCTTEAVTVVSPIDPQGTFYKVAGTTTYGGLTWFDQGADNAIRSNTSEFINVKTTFVGSFTGNNNSAFALRFRVWDDSASAYVDYAETTFTTNGGILANRSESVVLISPQITLSENDRIEVWVANTTDFNDITMLLNSRLIIEEAKS